MMHWTPRATVRAISSKPSSYLPDAEARVSWHRLDRPSRMEAMLATGEAIAVAICDPNPEMAQQAHASQPTALLLETLDAMLALDLDGVVIATPSALHAEQSCRRSTPELPSSARSPSGAASEVETVLSAAERADRLLGVDLSYRDTAAMQAIRQRLGELGKPFAADFAFHNAYGPGAGWFWDLKLSGGGCSSTSASISSILHCGCSTFPKSSRRQQR